MRRLFTRPVDEPIADHPTEHNACPAGNHEIAIHKESLRDPSTLTSPANTTVANYRIRSIRISPLMVYQHTGPAVVRMENALLLRQIVNTAIEGRE